MRPCFTASSRNMPELPTPTCARVRARGHALMTHPVNPRSFGMKFIALAHVTTYTRPPFYSLGGLGTRLGDQHVAIHMEVSNNAISSMRFYDDRACNSSLLRACQLG